MAVQLVRRLINVEEYTRMIEAGILTEQDKVELINGEIIEMSPSGSKHAAIIDRISNFLVSLLHKKVIIRDQSPVVTNSQSAPEPDIAVLKPKSDFYANRHPRATDTLLVIEVADSSLSTDREVKLPLYAKAGIPEYWIINLEKNEIEAHRSPQEDIYTLREILRPGKTITFFGLDIEIEVEQLLG